MKAVINRESKLSSDGRIRCFGNGIGEQFFADYHDKEWGVPRHDERGLFEMLILEGAQAGLSWKMVLKKRKAYRKAFYKFDPAKVASMSDSELERLRQNSEIIRNRLKIYSVRNNAQVFLQIEHEFHSFDCYVWNFVGNKPIINHWKSRAEIPASTVESNALSRDLRKRGMTFVGPTIIYAYMQAVGMVNDHLISCWRYKPLAKLDKVHYANCKLG